MNEIVQTGLSNLAGAIAQAAQAFRNEAWRKAEKALEDMHREMSRQNYTLLRGDQLQIGTVILEHRNGKTYRNKVVDIDPRGRLSRDVKVWVDAGRTRKGWVYHPGGMIEVAA